MRSIRNVEERKKTLGMKTLCRREKEDIRNEDIRNVEERKKTLGMKTLGM